MKVLVITSKIPYPLTNGSSLIVYHIFKRLAVRHKIYLISFSKNSDDRKNLKYLKDIFTDIYMVDQRTEKRSFFRYLRNVFSWNTGFLMKEQHPENYREFRGKVEEVISLKHIDIVHSVSLFTAEFSFDVKECIKVLHIIDSNTLALERRISAMQGSAWIKKLQEKIWYYRLKKYERRMIREFDLCITVGKQDFEVLKLLSPDANVFLIPNGVDTDYYYVLPKSSSGHPTLIFFGNMSFPPNVDAVMYFYREIFPLVRVGVPDVRLLVVGKSPYESIKKLGEDENVVVTGYIEDTRKYIAMADVVICPMRIGGGIKNKILEAMSLGRAVVSTSIGAEGINVTSGENILIADTPAEFADSTIKMLNDSSFRERMIRNARELINEHYTWDECSKKYEELCEGILKVSSNFGETFEAPES